MSSLLLPGGRAPSYDQLRPGLAAMQSGYGTIALSRTIRDPGSTRFSYDRLPERNKTRLRSTRIYSGSPIFRSSR